jgi:plastocyanin
MAPMSSMPGPSPGPGRSAGPAAPTPNRPSHKPLPTLSPSSAPRPSPTKPAASTPLQIVDYAFTPQSMSIPAGTVVRVTNDGQVAHTWTSNTGLWDSHDLQPGQTYSYRFLTPGVYSYGCSIHPSMTGTITVQ